MKKNYLTILTLVMVSLIFVSCASQSTQETWRLGDYKGYYVGLKLNDENKENPIVTLRFEFTNYSNAPISFAEALNPIISQDGMELDRISSDTDSLKMPVPPGETHNIDLSYRVANKDSLIDIKITNKDTGESYSATNHFEQ